MKDVVTVIIRETGERTTQACYDIIRAQVPETSIHIVNEAPFSKAVIRTFEIGVSENKEWTLAIDADLLLSEGAINQMIEKAKGFGENLYIYQGMILDNIFGSYRFGGPHLYRTQHLTQALKELSTSPNEMRPESFTYRKMAAKGFFTYCDTVFYALHDYEQYAKDYYRKGFFHGKKAFPAQLGDMLDTIRRNVQSDRNCEIALAGLRDGILDAAPIEVDIQYFDKKYEKFLERRQEDNTEISETFFVLEEEYVRNIQQSHQQAFPEIQPDSWKPYYLNENGKELDFGSPEEKAPRAKKSFVSRGFGFIGRKLVRLSKKIN